MKTSSDVEHTDIAYWAESCAPTEAKKHIGAIITLSLVNAWAKYRNAPKQLPIPCKHPINKHPINQKLSDSIALPKLDILCGDSICCNVLTADKIFLKNLTRIDGGLTIKGLPFSGLVYG